jgi:hypothetical protein
VVQRGGGYSGTRVWCGTGVKQAAMAAAKSSKQQALAFCLEEGEGKNRKKRPAGIKGMGFTKGNELGRIRRDGLRK